MAANKPRVEGEHYWITKKSVGHWVFCKWCGNVRRRDRKNGACKGPIGVELRKLEAGHGE